MYIFQSQRLGFRKWNENDLAQLHELCADEEVMKYFVKTLNLEETKALYGRLVAQFDQHGYGLYAIDLLNSKEFIGFIGFLYCDFDAPFTPCVEIGWRLHKKHWNKGLATEGALRCLEYGRINLGFEETYSFTAINNRASERIMQKIGMTKKGEFDHPKVPNDHPLERHHLYYKKLKVGS